MNNNFKEELANTISHGIGVLFGLMFLPFLMYRAIDSTGFVQSFPFMIYSFSFVFLFLSSTFYHAVQKTKLKTKLQKLDHVAIYFMIAGSYTPFIFACLRDGNQWIFLALIWSIVLFGSIFKIFYTGRFENLSLLLYLAMGWMVIFMIKPFFANLDLLTISLVAAGGLFYTGGVYFYSKDHKRYHHFIWHLFVLAGSVMHYIAIFLLVY